MFLPFPFMNILLTILLILCCLAFSAEPQLRAEALQTQDAPQKAKSAHADEAGTEKARQYLRDGRTGDAEVLLEAILTDSPDSIEANELLGTLRLNQRRLQEAEKCFEVVLRSNPRDDSARKGERDAAVALALQLRRAGDGAAALLALEQAQTFLFDDPVLLTDLGIQADAMHQYDLAAKTLGIVLKQKADEPTALYALARTESDRDHPREAERLFRAYLAIRADDASAHYGLGRVFQRQQRTEDAAGEFRRSLELQPVQTESYYQLGQMALDAHRDEEARAMFQKTLSRLPMHGGAQTGLGVLDFRARQFESARGVLSQAITSAPDYEPAHYYLGLTLARLGDKAASKRELGIAAQLAKSQQDKGDPIGVISPGDPP